jgi:hypothetical protein
MGDYVKNCSASVEWFFVDQNSINRDTIIENLHS